QLARGNQEYNRGRAQHRKQVPFVTALYRAPRHLRLRLCHHPRLLQIASVAEPWALPTAHLTPAACSVAGDNPPGRGASSGVHKGESGTRRSTLVGQERLVDIPSPTRQL